MPFPYELFPPLTPERYGSIKDSIQEVGVLVRIVRDEEGNIIDGFHRHKICDELGIHCPDETKRFANEAEKYEFALRANCERRQLNRSQREQLVEAYIKCDPELSSNALASTTGISDKTITKIRQRLESTSEIPKLNKFRGLDGKRRRRSHTTIIADTPKQSADALQYIKLVPDNGKTLDHVSAKRSAKRQVRRNGLPVSTPKNVKVQPTPSHPAEVICGECLDVMNRLDPKSVSVVVTSPPYNHDVPYNSYLDSRPEAEYLKWLDGVFRAIHRVLRDDGSFFLNVGSSRKKPWTAMRVAEIAGRIFQLQNEIIWVKSISLNGRTQGHFQPISGDRFLNHNFEQVYHFSKSGDVKLDRLALGVEYEDRTNLLRNNASENCRCGGDVWFIPYETVTNGSQRGEHPATYPVALPERCIKLHGVSNDCVVLDPFCGTGSTLLAAERLGVRSIGIDVDSAYCDHATHRMEDARSQYVYDINDIRLFHCPFQNLEATAAIDPGSVDLVLTDIPYGKSFLPQLDDIAQLAARILKDGGLFVTYSGTYYLQQVMVELSQHLTYRWMCASTWDGDGNLSHQRNVIAKWKPILVYSRGDWTKRPNWPDVSLVNSKEKEWHPWQQPLEEVESWLRYFSGPGDLVVDLCGGSFTTAVACLRNNRRFIGCDIDAGCVEKGHQRLAAELSESEGAA